MTAKELYEYFDSMFPSSLSCEWDNDGLMCCPAPDKEIKKVLVTLDVTERAVNYAADNSFDAIISHHPLIFKPAKNITSPKLIKLIKNDITVMSFHTRLDAAEGGVNDKFAELIGLEETYAFGPDGDKTGRIGTFSEETSLAGFAAKLKRILECERLNIADAEIPVKKVALLGGSGNDFAEAAILEGADTYVTGQLSYNIMCEAKEKKINFIEAGHFYTEDFICEYIISKLREKDGRIYTEHFCSNEIRFM